MKFKMKRLILLLPLLASVASEAQSKKRTTKKSTSKNSKKASVNSRSTQPKALAPTPTQAARTRKAPAPVRRSGTSGATIKNLMEAGNYEQALKLLASANDASSRSMRAVIFERMGYQHAALAELVGSYRARPSEAVANRAGGLAFLLGESRLVQGLPTSSLGVRLAMAQDALVRGNLAQATSLLPTTQAIEAMQPSVFKAKAVVLASAILNATGNTRGALDVLSGTFPQTPGVDLSEIRLQRAMILFDVKKYSEALDELMFITRSSPTWYRGQTVSAWSAFHVEDYNLALGQLMNLRSPFLTGKFNPEKDLLQSVVLFQLCHYESASRALAKLKEDYGNMNSAFVRVAGIADSPSRFYKELTSFAAGSVKADSTGVDRVWDGILSQPFVANTSASIEKLRFERKNIDQSFRTRELQTTRGALLRIFEKLEESYVAKIARYSKPLIEKMKNDVKESLEGALAVDLEVNTRVRDRLIKAAVPVQKNINFKKEVQKGYEFWPFQGEFWRDETGGYAFATTDVCEEGVR